MVSTQRVQMFFRPLKNILIFQVYRYSFLARYAAVNIQSSTPVDILPPEIDAEEAFLQNLVWGPSGTALAFVYRNNIYYQESLTAVPRQITTTGQLNVIYHGIPDWVYEGWFIVLQIDYLLFFLHV